MKKIERVLLYQDYDSTDDFIDDNDQSGIFRDFLSSEQFSIDYTSELSVLKLWNDAMYICAYFASKKHPVVCFSEIWNDFNQSIGCSRLLAYAIMRLVLPDSQEKERLMRKIETYNASRYQKEILENFENFIISYKDNNKLKALYIYPSLRCVEKTKSDQWCKACNNFSSVKDIEDVLKLYRRKSDQHKALSAIHQAFESIIELPF